MQSPRSSRVLRFASAVAALALIVAGCSSSDDAGATGSAPFKTVTPGELTVGAPTFPPFVGVSDGKITGPDGEIVNAIAARYGLKVVTKPYDFAGLIPAVQQGRIDLAIGSIFRTQERAKVVDFSDPIYIEPGAFIAKSKVDRIDDLKGKRVGTVQGYNWNTDFKAIYGTDLTLYPSSTELKQDLVAGRLDAAIDSHGTALYLYKDSGFVVSVLPGDERVESTTSPGQTAIVLRKGNTDLQKALDQSITTLRDDGSIAKFLTDAGLDPTAVNTGEPRLA